MALVPAIQEFLQIVEQSKQRLLAQGFKMNQSNTREALANMTRNYVTNYPIDLRIIDDCIQNDGYPVPIRIYIPVNVGNEPLKVGLFIHGGGHMCGSITVYDGIVRHLAQTTNTIIVSVDYRLSPEFAYPIGLNDCATVAVNLFTVLNEWQINYSARELILIGDSGGGAVCATLALDRELVHRANIVTQILVYPSLDYTLTSDGIAEFGVGYLLEKSKVSWYFDNYFQHGEDRKALSPVYGKFYPQHPRTLVITAEYDPLHSEGESYYSKLAATGVEAKLSKISGVIHAFLMLENLCKAECQETYRQVAEFIHSGNSK